MFINLPAVATTGAGAVEALTFACSVCEGALSYYRGTMRQFLQEDKGVTCIGAYHSISLCLCDCLCGQAFCTAANFRPMTHQLLAIYLSC